MSKRVWHYSGDVSPLGYGGKWIRSLGDGKRFHVVELINMDEACGSDNEGQPRYVVELSEIDLSVADLRAAASCCGLEDPALGYEPLAMVEAVHSYGQKAPLSSESTDNAMKAVGNAKRESRELESNVEAYEARMGRPVNAIGSTAREYQAGDTNSAILRGVAAGNPDAELMLKMMGAAKKGED